MVLAIKNNASNDKNIAIYSFLFYTKNILQNIGRKKYEKDK